MHLSHPDEAKKLIDSIFSAHNLDELYDSTRTSESDNRAILKDIDDNYPKLLKEGNLASVLEAAKRKKRYQISMIRTRFFILDEAQLFGKFEQFN